MEDQTQRAPYNVGRCLHYTQKVMHYRGLDIIEGLTTTVTPPIRHITSGKDTWWRVDCPSKVDSVSRFTPYQVVSSFPKDDRTLIFEVVNKFFSVNDVDMLLNFVEAEDTIATFKSLSKKQTLASARRFFSGSSKQRLKVLADRHLAYSFGIAPLISDLQSLWSNFRQVESQMKKYQAQCNKPIRFAATSRGNHVFSFGGVAYDGGTMSHHLSTINAERRVVLSGIRRSPYLTESAKWLDFLVQRFGAVGPASLAWEKVPFSFVVDWFVDTGVCLGHLDNLLTGSTKVIQRLSGSTKDQYAIKCKMSRHSAAFTNTAPPVGTDVGYQYVRRYTREPLLVPYGFNWSGRFGKKQWALAGSLLTQIISGASR